MFLINNRILLLIIIVSFSNCEKDQDQTVDEKFPRNVVINKEENIFSGFPSFEIIDGVFKTRYFTRTNSSHIDTLGGEEIKQSFDKGNNWLLSREKMVDGIKGFKSPFFNLYPIGWSYLKKTKKDSLIREGRIVQDLDTDSDLVGFLSQELIKVKFFSNGVKVIDTIMGPRYMSFIIGLPNFTGHLKVDNTLLATVYGRRKGSALDEPLIMRSDDNGVLWEFIPMLNTPPTTIGFNEVAIEQNLRGDIIAMMRTSNNSFLYQSISKDKGLTWSTPKQTLIWGYPASIKRLKSGKLLCSYGYRKEPIGIRASLSHDGGVSWDINNEVILREDGFGYGGNSGYPESIEYEKGKIATVYYITDSTNITSVEMTMWKIE